MRLAFRTDATDQIGTGHLMRCLTLADAVQADGARSRFLCRNLPPHLAARVTARGHELVPLPAGPTGLLDDGPHACWLGTSQAADARRTAAALDDGEWDWVVADHYALDARWESALRGCARRILAIDDLADRAHDCDVLLDQNVYPDMETRYAGKVPAHCHVLLGPRYALLRDEFHRMRARTAPRNGAVGRLLVSFGGVDAANYTGAALAAIAAARARLAVDVVIGMGHAHRNAIETACERHGFGCHVETSCMAELMAGADLAIGAGGTTLWERCCLGLPALALSAAANQTAMLDEAAARGLVYAPAGAAANRAPWFALHLTALLDNPRLLQMMSRNAMQAVDGQGARRVARALDPRSIDVREATLDDADALFEWRNHAAVRSMSRDARAITRAEHEAWLRGVLRDGNRILLIAEHGGVSVGVVRFDVAGDRAQVSIYRVPGSSERGIASSVLRAAEAWLEARRPDVASLTAEVLQHNEASHELFRSTGYHVHSTVYEKRLS